MQEKTCLTTSAAATSGYNPLHSSPISNDKRYTLKVRKPELKPTDLFGPIVYQDDVVGTLAAWSLPGIDPKEFDKLSFAVKSCTQYTHLEKAYKEVIQSSPMLQWMLIPFLLGVNVGLEPLPEVVINVIRSNKEFFHFLVKQGAKYKHYLQGVYGIPSLKTVKELLDIFGADAYTPEGNTPSVIGMTLTSNFNHEAFEKIKAIIDAGGNINARIDDAYQNTELHYLIALEHHTAIVTQFIDQIENHKWPIDYTIQDKYGKTPLMLAVGLNNKVVVTQLIKKALGENKKDIGLNVADTYGRTPCMIAAALGHIELLEQLIQAGAQIYNKDKQGRDLLWYAQAPNDELRSIIEFFSIHPDRIASQNHSYLYSSTPEALPTILVDEQTKESHLLILSREEPHFSLLKIALKAALNSNDPELNYHYLRKQIEPFLNTAGKSILQTKISQQEETRRYIKEVLFRFACAFGDLELVEKIGAEQDFNSASCDHLNRTAMHYAVMTKKLVQEQIQTRGYSCSAEACLNGHPKVLEYLINKNSALLECKNVNGNTPLSLLQRDVNDVNPLTQQQAQKMLDLLEEHQLLPGVRMSLS